MNKILIYLGVLVFIFGSGFLLVDRPESSPKKINWYTLEEAQQLAENGDKKVLVYLEAQWCGYCKKMEGQVFPQQDVQDVIHEFYYPVRVDIESENTLSFQGEQMSEREFAGRLRVSATPTFLFVDGAGNMLGQQPGFMPADIFKALLSFVGSDQYETMKFNQYLEEQGIEG